MSKPSSNAMARTTVLIVVNVLAAVVCLTVSIVLSFTAPTTPWIAWLIISVLFVWAAACQFWTTWEG